MINDLNFFPCLLAERFTFFFHPIFFIEKQWNSYGHFLPFNKLPTHYTKKAVSSKENIYLLTLTPWSQRQQLTVNQSANLGGSWADPKKMALFCLYFILTSVKLLQFSFFSCEKCYARAKCMRDNETLLQLKSANNARLLKKERQIIQFVSFNVRLETF